MEEKPKYKDLCDPNVLMDAAKKCMKGVMWKYSTQAYYLDRIERIRITKERLEKRDRMSDGFVQFTVHERGKVRDIRSIHINERVIHRAENDVVLVPVLRPKLIYDNAASLKDRMTVIFLSEIYTPILTAWITMSYSGNMERYSDMIRTSWI